MPCWCSPLENDLQTSSLTLWQRAWLHRHKYAVVGYLGHGTYGGVFKCRIKPGHPFMRVFFRAREKERTRHEERRLRKSARWLATEGKRSMTASMRSMVSYFHVVKSTRSIEPTISALPSMLDEQLAHHTSPFPPQSVRLMENPRQSSLSGSSPSTPSAKIPSRDNSVNRCPKRADSPINFARKTSTGGTLFTPCNACSFASDVQRTKKSLLSFASFAASSSLSGSAHLGSYIDNSSMVEFISDELCKVMTLKKKRVVRELNVDELETVRNKINHKTATLTTTVSGVVGGSVLCAGADITGDSPSDLLSSLDKLIREMQKDDSTRPTRATTMWVEFVNSGASSRDDDIPGGFHLTANLEGRQRGFGGVAYLAKTISKMTFGVPNLSTEVNVAVKICPLLDEKMKQAIEYQIRCLTIKKRKDRSLEPVLRKKQRILRRQRDQLGKVSSESLLREVMVLQRCEHPNVIRVFEYFKCTHYLYVAFQLCFGSLSDAKISCSGLGDSHSLLKPLMTDLSSALMWIHNKKIVHRDVKPCNVLFVNPSLTEVVLADFGLSCFQSEVSSTIFGTPSFLPPEVWLNQMFTYTSDVWALGLTFIFLLTGKQWMTHSSSIHAMRRVKGDQGMGWNGSIIPKFQDSGLSKLVLLICKSVQNSVHATVSWDKIIDNLPEPQEKTMQLVNRCLHRDPNCRISAHDFLLNEWFDDDTTMPPTISTELPSFISGLME
eukprot:GEMP01016859.1.p1 GENE.GEMP01016859.1~~GEMP01016859.1.p1  ORF type:complete len:721 (+),score=127.31 GEMP01016859.1:100-2262(+)